MQIKKLMASILFASISLVSVPVAYANESDRKVKVATYNMYPGTEFSGIFTAQSELEVLLEVSEAFADVIASNVPERIDEIADQIATNRPDVVGLQEVAIWGIGPYDPGSSAPITFDFLQMLLDRLADRGASYEAIAIQENLTAELPGLFGPNFPSDLRDVRFTDRVVILARTDLQTSEIKIEATDNGAFVNVIPVSVLGTNLLITRGWASADIKHRGKTYRFLNTHLESFLEVFQILQAQELVVGPANTDLPLIVAGDFNSPAPVGTAYGVLLSGGLSDAWLTTNAASAGFTWPLSEEDPSALLDPTQRIDLILSRGALTATGSDLLGEEAADLTPSGFRPSDHAGVSASFVLHP